MPICGIRIGRGAFFVEKNTVFIYGLSFYLNLNKWNATERKEVLIAELQNHGILIEALYDAVDKEVDLFDLICHVAYDQKPLTRKERG